MIGQFTETMRSVGSNVLMGQGTILVVLGPPQAQMMARDGFSRQMLQERFFEDTKFLPEDWPFSGTSAKHKIGNLEGVHGWVPEERKIRITERPSDILIMVGGRADHIHSSYMPPMTFSEHTSALVW